MTKVIELAAGALSQLGDAHRAGIKTLITPVFNVQGYGAKGDGVTDDTTAIQTTIDAAAAAGGGIVFFPAGTYLFSKTIHAKNNITFQGVHRRSILKLANGVQAANFLVYGGGPRGIGSVPTPKVDRVQFIGLDIDGNKANQTIDVTPFSPNGWTNVVIDDVHVYNAGKSTTGGYAQGFVAFGVLDMYLTRSEFRNCTGDGAALAEGCMRTTVSDCHFLNNGDYGLAVTNNCFDMTVNNCIATGNTTNGIGVDECSRWAVTNNICANNGRAGIEVLRFDADFVNPHEQGIVSGNVCVGNTINGMAVAQLQYGTVTGNIIRNSGNWGLNVIGCTYVNFSANLLAQNGGIGTGQILVTAFAGQTCAQNLFAANLVQGNGTSNWGIRELNQGGTIGPNVYNGNLVRGAATDWALTANGYSMGFQDGTMRLDNITSATSATAGAGTALPGTPQGYMTVKVNGTDRKVPYYPT